MVSSFTLSVDHTQRRTRVRRTPLDEWSTRRKGLYLTTHNTQTSKTPTRFEPTIPAGERPHNYALDRAATGTGKVVLDCIYCYFIHYIANKESLIMFSFKFAFETFVADCATW